MDWVSYMPFFYQNREGEFAVLNRSTLEVRFVSVLVMRRYIKDGGSLDFVSPFEHPSLLVRWEEDVGGSVWLKDSDSVFIIKRKGGICINGISFYSSEFLKLALFEMLSNGMFYFLFQTDSWHLPLLLKFLPGKGFFVKNVRSNIKTFRSANVNGYVQVPLWGAKDFFMRGEI